MFPLPRQRQTRCSGRVDGIISQEEMRSLRLKGDCSQECLAPQKGLQCPLGLAFFRKLIGTGMEVSLFLELEGKLGLFGQNHFCDSFALVSALQRTLTQQCLPA